MAKTVNVERPLKKSEFEIRFASSHARNGWRDLKATQRNSLVDAWDFLTKTPLERTSVNYRLRDTLSTLTYQGTTYERWQHKPTLKGSARIWFFVDQMNRIVYLEKVFTAHPNETK